MRLKKLICPIGALFLTGRCYSRTVSGTEYHRPTNSIA